MSSPSRIPDQALTPYSEAVRDLHLGFHVSMLRDKPAELAGRLNERIKLAAKFLSKASGAQHSKSLEAVAQALRFANWHQLSTHFSRAEIETKLPATWCDELSNALLLLVETEPEISLPDSQIQAFQSFGRALSMLTDVPLQAVLDDVCAGLCAGKTWNEVRNRSPLRATTPLYRFVLDDELERDVDDEDRRDGKKFGHFDWSPACYELVETLDEWWQGYDHFTKPQKKKARKWVEDVLAAQPGFLEAGLALAVMQNDADEPEAAATLNRFIRQAEALIPAGFNGRIEWLHVDSRFYHRMLWLRMQMHYDADDLKSAVKIARRQLKLNPNDNLGVRFVHPLLLLQLREFAMAKRATKALEGEGMTAALVRAFTEFALGNRTAFRRELADALISLPVIRLLLLNQTTPLPDGDDGYRGIRPELETFMEFAWPVYTEVPGLRRACQAFLAEPRVLEVEARLRKYWKGYQGIGDDKVGTFAGWEGMCRWAMGQLAEPALLSSPYLVRQ